MRRILVIDQGTHASRALLYSARGELIDREEAPIDLVRIGRERVEQDPRQILRSVRRVIGVLLARNRVPVERAALAVQRSTVLAWDRESGRALSPALSWQDRRALADLARFESARAAVYRRTGLPLSPHYGAGKLRWLLHANRDVQRARDRGTLCLGPLVSYLLYHLLPGAPHRVDHSNAHRTLLFDIATLRWSEPLLELFEIPPGCLPRPAPLQGDWGCLDGSAIPLTAVCGDQNAALFSRGALPDDAAVVNLGTGAFLLMPVSAPVSHAAGLLQGIAKSDGEGCRYLIEGTVNGAGAALSWAQQRWPADDLFDHLDDWLAQSRSPPLFINTLGGLGSPWWRSGDAPRFTGPPEMPVAARYTAIIESIAFLLQRNLELLRQIDAPARLYLGGGLSRLDGLCQRLVDLGGLPAYRFREQESTARGAAWLAAGSPEAWRSPPPERCFTPGKNVALQRRYAQFLNEIEKCRT